MGFWGFGVLGFGWASGLRLRLQGFTVQGLGVVAAGFRIYRVRVHRFRRARVMHRCYKDSPALPPALRASEWGLSRIFGEE